MAREFTRQDDERLLALIAALEAEGIEVFIDENERPSFLEELMMSGPFEWAGRGFWKITSMVTL